MFSSCVPIANPASATSPTRGIAHVATPDQHPAHQPRGDENLDSQRHPRSRPFKNKTRQAAGLVETCICREVAPDQVAETE